MSGLFYNLGRRIGRKAVPVIRKTKWIWDGLAGSEEEALRAENSLGKVLVAELRSATAPAHDPALSAWVDGLCQRLAAKLKEQKRSFHCELFHDPVPAAMSLPGGFIFLSDSLVELCGRDPDEMAFVIGHEIAHVVRRDTWNRMLNEAVFRVASALTARAGAAGAWLRQKGLVTLRSAHDRDCESEADEFGIRLAVAAGFNASGALELLRRIAISGPHGPDLGRYFGSHPAASDRLKALEQVLRQMARASAPKPGPA